MDCAGSNACSATVSSSSSANANNNNNSNTAAVYSTMATPSCVPVGTHQTCSSGSVSSTVCLSSECAPDAPLSSASPTAPLSHQHRAILHVKQQQQQQQQQSLQHSPLYHDIHNALTCTIPHQHQTSLPSPSSCSSTTPLVSASLLGVVPQPTTPTTAEASAIDDCCTQSAYSMVTDFCCTPVEANVDCCASHTPSLAPQSADARTCCSSSHPPVLSTSGYDLAAIECCIIESALREGLDSACCQDLIKPGELLTPQCCTEHPDVIDECCSTCCPDNHHQQQQQQHLPVNNGLATPISVLNTVLSSSPSSSSSGSSCNTTPSSAASTTSSPSTTAASNYFGFQPSVQVVPSTNRGHLCNDVNLHDHRHWRHHHHQSHTHPIQPPQQHHHMQQQQRNICTAVGQHHHHHPSSHFLSHHHKHSSSSSSPDILTTPPLLSTASDISSQTSSLQVSPETKQLEEAQIDHMIKCLWTGCTAEFMSQDDLLPHVEQHFPSASGGGGDGMLNDHPFCQWESCATELLDWDTLIQHLQEDHHILDTSAQDMSATGFPSGTCVPQTSINTSCDQQPQHLSSPSSSSSSKKSSGCCGPKPPALSTIISKNHTGHRILPSPSSAITPTTPTTPQVQPSSSHHHQQNDNHDLEEPDHTCRWRGCGQVFESFDALTTHLSEDHIGTGKSEYRCEWEGCERNGRLFSQRQKAMRHIQTHTGDKPYQCQICHKRFSEANIMAQHMRTHTGEKPFKCNFPGCGREFSISGALTIHKRVHTGEKPFKCKFEGCNKWFAESSNLTKHLRVHTGERPFKCPFPGCGKSFSRPDQVTRHKRTHMTDDEKLEAAILSAKHGGGNNAGASGSGSNHGHLNRTAVPAAVPAAGASHAHRLQPIMPNADNSGSIEQERPSKRVKTEVLPRIIV